MDDKTQQPRLHALILTPKDFNNLKAFLSRSTVKWNEVPAAIALQALISHAEKPITADEAVEAANQAAEKSKPKEIS